MQRVCGCVCFSWRSSLNFASANSDISASKVFKNILTLDFDTKTCSSDLPCIKKFFLISECVSDINKSYFSFVVSLLTSWSFHSAETFIFLDWLLTAPFWSGEVHAVACLCRTGSSIAASANLDHIKQTTTRWLLHLTESYAEKKRNSIMSAISANLCDQNSGQATAGSLKTIISFFTFVSTCFSVCLLFFLL